MDIAAEDQAPDAGHFLLLFGKCGSVGRNHGGRSSDTGYRVAGTCLDPSDQQGDVRSLPAAVGVQFIEYQEPQIFEDVVPDVHIFSAPGQDQLQHHVVGHQDMGRVNPHFVPRFFIFLSGILAIADGKDIAHDLSEFPDLFGKAFATLFEGGSRGQFPFEVVAFVFPEFLMLRVDQGIHGINDDCLGFPGQRGFGAEDRIEDGGDVSQRFSGAGARGDDELLPFCAQRDGLFLVFVKLIAIEDILQFVMQQSGLHEMLNGLSLFKGRVKLDQWVGPQFFIVQFSGHELQ